MTLLADVITPFALSALKYGLFALLFLFIWRSMRWVVRGLSVAEAAAAAPASPAPPCLRVPRRSWFAGRTTRKRGP